MSSQRTLVIGDVHGCLDELQDLLKLSKYQASDRLIFVGDLIHKGPDSKGVLELVRSLNAECVMGNHELRFLKSCKGDGHDNPETLRVKKQLGRDLERWIPWIGSLPSYIEGDVGGQEILVVHAGVLPNQNVKHSRVEDLANIRTWDGKGEDLQDEKNLPWFEFYKLRRLVIYGHWARMGLVQRENVIGLDSGCVYGKQLSALVLPERRILQVQARKAYAHL